MAQEKYAFTLKELVTLIEDEPIKHIWSDVDKELELRRYFNHNGKEPIDD